MTNIVKWNDNAICLSDGLFWVLEGTKWTAAEIRNRRNEASYRSDKLMTDKQTDKQTHLTSQVINLLQVDTRDGLLRLLGSTLELTKFLPTRERCNQLILYRFTVSTLQPTSSSIPHRPNPFLHPENGTLPSFGPLPVAPILPSIRIPSANAPLQAQNRPASPSPNLFLPPTNPSVQHQPLSAYTFRQPKHRYVNPSMQPENRSEFHLFYWPIII